MLTRFISNLRPYRFCTPFLSLLCVIPAQADFEAGKRAYEQADYATALRELGPLAKQGDSNAQTLLGTMHLLGRGVPHDLGSAFKWYKSAAEQGNPEAEFHLGSFYLFGPMPPGATRDQSEALKWLKLSADQGMPDAQLVLGLTYMNLPEVRDLVQADMWLQLAAEHGDLLAPRQRGIAEEKMTRDQIAQAKALAEAWKSKTSGEAADHKGESNVR